MSKVNVYDDESVVARVEYNEKLDFWDGSNWTSGSTGRHLGITKLRDGRFVLIHGSQWQSERSSAEVVSAETALDAILRSGNTAILEEKKFKELKELMKTSMSEEDPDEPEAASEEASA